MTDGGSTDGEGDGEIISEPPGSSSHGSPDEEIKTRPGRTPAGAQSFESVTFKEGINAFLTLDILLNLLGLNSSMRRTAGSPWR
jgi:hypothetical protein